MTHQSISIVFLFVLITSLCAENADDVCQTDVCERESKIIYGKMDESIEPCDDFYQFACGKFVRDTKVPDDQTTVDFVTILDDKLKKQLKNILSEPADGTDAEPLKLCKKLYKTCMNQELIESRGLKPMKRIMESLGGWPVVENKNWNDRRYLWQNVMLKLELMGFSINYIFEGSIDVDMKNSTRKSFYIDQPSLGIDRDYLIKGTSSDIVQAYHEYQIDTAVIYGAERSFAESEMKDVLNFEIEVAKISTPKEERRNMTRLYNPITIREFQHIYPIHDWLKYLNALLPSVSRVVEDKNIILTDFKYIVTDLYDILKKTPNRVVINFIFWRLSASVADLLSSVIRDRQLQFEKVLSGKERFEARWEECVQVTMTELDISTSALYVRNFFKKESKVYALQIVQSIKKEFEESLRNVSWMDEKTMAAALIKINDMATHIGYPEELLNDTLLSEYYKDLVINDQEFFETMLNVSKFDIDYKFKNFRKPVNKTEWRTHANAAVINAFYNPLENSIQFPAGILQGQFFSAERPRYINFGAIGSVIGHEITHGFDDEGSQFDSSGNLIDWWEEGTKKAYLEKARCIIEQYGNYTEPNVDLQLNGINTQGENIADNGGLKIAYLAYQKFVAENGFESILPELNYTTNQLFWISAAQTWCSVQRPEETKMRITMDVHSPEKFRVNGPVSNMKEFSEDFECPEGSPMNPIEKCEVW